MSLVSLKHTCMEQRVASGNVLACVTWVIYFTRLFVPCDD